MSHNGIYVLDIDDEQRLKECFVSEIRDLMIKYQVDYFRGEFKNDSGFNLNNFNLHGLGASFYDLNYTEAKN